MNRYITEFIGQDFACDIRVPGGPTLREDIRMIDLKLNELPIDATGDFTVEQYRKLTPEQQAEVNRIRKAAGLSIFDTLAAEPTMSVGSRGTDTSGVAAGAGAGAGRTITTPGTKEESPAPDVIDRSRGTGR